MGSDHTGLGAGKRTAREMGYCGVCVYDLIVSALGSLFSRVPAR